MTFKEKKLAEFEETWELHQKFCSYKSRLVRVCDSNCKNVFDKLFSESIEEAIRIERERIIEIVEKYEGPENVQSHPEFAKVVQNTIVQGILFSLNNHIR